MPFPAGFPGCLRFSWPREGALGSRGDRSVMCLTCPSKSPGIPAVRVDGWKASAGQLRAPKVTSLVIAGL